MSSLQLSQPQKAFLLPGCTYSIIAMLVPSRQERGVATWRAGRRGNVQNTPVNEWVCKLKPKPHSPLPPHFIGDRARNKPVSENEGALVSLRGNSAAFGTVLPDD